MADLTLRADERGQILLIGAFALAALFVTLALILNVVIYTENLATRTESTTSDAVAHSQSVERATVDLLQYVNEYETSLSNDYPYLRDRFETGFGNFTNGMARYQLTSGVVINGTIRKQFEGTWLKQINESRNFTSISADPVDWEPVTGEVNGVRSFQIEVWTIPGSFEVEASDGTGDSWELDISNSDITVSDTDGTHTCSPPSTFPYRINVSEGTVEGISCDLPGFAEDLGPVDSIWFENPEEITGRYQLMVNETEGSPDISGFGSDLEGPFTNRSLYGAIVGIDYQTTTLAYRTDRRVVPGETDD